MAHLSFEIFIEGSVGLDCTELGISLKNGSTSSPPPKPKDDKKENEGIYIFTKLNFDYINKETVF